MRIPNTSLATIFPGLATVLGLALLTSQPAYGQPKLIVWGSNGYGQTNVPPGLNDVVAIASGENHCLALRSNGRIVAWGDNTEGQTNVPPSLTNAMTMAGGQYHSLAVRSNGTVVAWGLNNYGQSTVPPGLTNVIAVSAGRNHNMALRNNGTVVVWGDGFSGQTNVPPGLTNVTQIAARDNHCLALRANGTVVGWGENGSGQADPPLNLTNAMSIAAGYHHNLAIRSNGLVVAWGVNVYGETTNYPGTADVSAVSAGYFLSTALRSNGVVLAWGKDFSGETTVPPQIVKGYAIAAGWDHVMALADLMVMPDNFADRMAIEGSNVVLALSNVGSTIEPGEPQHSSIAFDDPKSSIWLTWTAPFSGGAILSMASSFSPPVIAVYTGNSLGTLVRVGDNLGGSGQNLMVFSAEAGTTYQIALSALDQGGGTEGSINFQLQLRPPPVNDLFASRTVIGGSFFDTNGSFIGAAKQSSEPNHAGVNGDPSYLQTLWWTWTAPTNVGVSSMPVRLMADAVSQVPNIGVYTGTAVGSLAVVPSTTVTNGMTRVTSFTASAGTSYQIALSGHHSDPFRNNLSYRFGDFRFRLSMQALFLSLANVNATNDSSGTTFGVTAQVTNYGSAGSNPLRARVLGVSGVGVRGVDSGFVVNTNYVSYVTNLAALSPGQGRVARMFGSLPAAFVDPNGVEGIGYGAYAELQEQFGTNWHTIDQTIIGFGEWPDLGGFGGPGGGVIRLDPGLSGGAFIPLTSVRVIGPTTVPEGSMVNYTGLATYGNGTQISFSNTVWTASLFSITNGVFTSGAVANDTPVTLVAKYSSSGFLYDAITNIVVLNQNVMPSKMFSPAWVNGTFSMQLQGVANRKYAVDATTNLSAPIVWQALSTNQLGGSGVWNFSEPTLHRQRYYRAREVP